MKAVLLYEHGDVDKLRYEDTETPACGAKDVLVRVKACALNHLDVWVRKGLPSLRLKYPHILGSDIAGVVESAGSEVTHVKPGDKVVVNPGVSCGCCEACLTGRDNFCPKYGIVGENMNGGYAEFVCVPQQNAAPMPDNLSFEEAASIALVFMTAWQMIERAQIKSGEWVLVHAAGSGVGSAAIQLAKLFGARVLTTASSDEKLEKAKSLGAEHGINYAKTDFSDEVRRLTGKRGADVILDHVGKDTFEKNIACMAWGGRMVLCGASTGLMAQTNLAYLFFKQLSILGSTMSSKSRIFPVLKLAQEGKIKPVIDSVFPLTEVKEAHKRMENRELFGKIVLTIP